MYIDKQMLPESVADPAREGGQEMSKEEKNADIASDVVQVKWTFIRPFTGVIQFVVLTTLPLSLRVSRTKIEIWDDRSVKKLLT